MSAPLPIPPRVWSYTLLKRCEISVSVDEQDHENRSQIGALWLESYSPEHGKGYVTMSGPAKQTIARWLYGVVAISPRYLDARPAQAQRLSES
ncbi:MAG TPA: hypothetical protein VGO48_11435 [Conexibacter sp.]|jgi:hypothetical protein|nr:hypothetical protein [Conexibacter sp.]